MRRTPEPGASGVGLAQDVGQAARTVAGAMDAKRATDERVRDEEHRLALIQDANRLSAATADHATRLETGRTELLRQIQEKRAAAAAGAEGHEEAINQLVDTWSADFMGTLGTDPRLAEKFAPHVAAAAGTIKVSEHKFALEARAAKQVTDRVDLMDGLANGLFTDPSQANLERATSLWETSINASLLPEDKKAELRQAGRKAFKVRAWQGAAERDPKAALAELDKGVLNDVAEGGEIVALRNSAQAASDRIDAQARAAASAQVEEFREQSRVMIEDVNRGVDVDPGQLSALAASAAEAGDSRLQQDLEDAAARVAVRARYRGESLAELDAARRQVEQSGDWRKNRQLVAAHTELGAMIERTRTRASSDKLGLWSEHGGRLSPFSLTDPGAMRARIAQARAAQGKYGGPLQIMTEAEAAPIRDEFARALPGDQAAMIATMSAYGRDYGKALIRQIAPDKPERYAVLGDLATMRNARAGQATVRQALSGWKQMEANKGLVDAKRLREAIDREYGAALVMMDPSTRQGVMDVATGVYADAAAKGNATAFDGELAARSFAAALGRIGDGTGGVGRRGSTPMVLPHGMTQNDFDTVLARAGGEDIRNGAFGGKDSPLWNGQPMRPSEFKALTPVMWRDGLYMFRNSTGFVTSARDPGRNFILDIRATGRLAFRRGK